VSAAAGEQELQAVRVLGHQSNDAVAMRFGAAEQGLGDRHRCRRAEQCQPGDALRMARGALEGDQRAHRVSDQHRLLDAGGVEQGRQPVGEFLDTAQGWTSRLAMSRQVRDQQRAAGGGESAGDGPPAVAVVGGAVDQQQRWVERAGRVEGFSPGANMAAFPGDVQLHVLSLTPPFLYLRFYASNFELFSRSGLNIRFESAFELVDAILEQQLAFFEAAHQQLVGRRAEQQVIDHQIEVAMLDVQFFEGGACFCRLFFAEHGGLSLLVGVRGRGRRVRVV
jgi:hypothetical protein